jgi:hypothetical protein
MNAIGEDKLAAIDRAFTAIRAARKHARKALGSGAPGAGEIPCPACGSGVIRYTVRAPYGRLDGACSTSGCVLWSNQ